MPPSTTSPTCAGDAVTGRRARLVAAMGLITDYETTLSRRFMDGVAAIPDLRLWGITDTARIAERTPTFGLTSASRTPARDGTGPRPRGHLLPGMATSTPRRSSSDSAWRTSGGVLRLGFVHYNTEAEVDRTLEALEVITRPS